jgi:hypothetical protein
MRVDIGSRGRRIVLRGLTDEEIWFEGPGLEPSGDAALAFSLLVAMSRGEPLNLVEPISPQLAERVPTLQSIFSCWFDRLTPIEVTARTAATLASDSSRRTMQFFTGGVDSFYTLIKNRPVVDALVYVHGFDVKLRDEALRLLVSQQLSRAAELSEKPLLEVTTNLKESVGRHGRWNIYHGAALSGVAHLLANGFGAALFPATYAYDELYPLGSHPLTDPMWSGSALTVVHTGAEATRHQKIEAIVTDLAVRETLRVCWENREGSYNCGQCEKCIRTMVSLKALGVLEDLATFNGDLNPSQIWKDTLKTPAATRFASFTLKALRESGEVPELVRALEWQLRLSPLKLAIRAAAKRAVRPVRRVLARRAS